MVVPAKKHEEQQRSAHRPTNCFIIFRNFAFFPRSGKISQEKQTREEEETKCKNRFLLLLSFQAKLKTWCLHFCRFGDKFHCCSRSKSCQVALSFFFRPAFSVRFSQEENSLFVFQRFNLLIHCYAWLDQVEARYRRKKASEHHQLRLMAHIKNMAELSKKHKKTVCLLFAKPISISINFHFLPYRSLQPKYSEKEFSNQI